MIELTNITSLNAAFFALYFNILYLNQFQSDILYNNNKNSFP